MVATPEADRTCKTCHTTKPWTVDHFFYIARRKHWATECRQCNGARRQKKYLEGKQARFQLRETELPEEDDLTQDPPLEDTLLGRVERELFPGTPYREMSSEQFRAVAEEVRRRLGVRDLAQSSGAKRRVYPRER